MEQETTLPERHPKGWGYEDWIVNNERYCSKILHFNKGKKCSVHYHLKKDETFYLLRGRLKILLSDSPETYKEGRIETIIMNPQGIVHIWPVRVHRMEALEESDLLEISTQHFEEDSYRIERGD